MNMFDSLFSPGHALNEKIARQVFDILPEQGPLMVILDLQGHCWPSNSHEFSSLNINKSYLKELTAKIDDGAEPVITQINDCSIVATQLATPKTNCGYILFIFSKNTPEAAMVNMDLIEILLNQTNLVAKLIEQNSQLYELSVKQYAAASYSEIAFN
jgi:hypothetical protein